MPLALVFLLVLAQMPASSDLRPRTRAESTGYRETSRYEDVIAFIRELEQRGAPISLRYMGSSREGRRIPLVLASRPAVEGPAEAWRAGKAVVYVQANIHGGEVEGKEASLMLLRDLAEDARLLDRLVLLVAPVYNIDGNESWGPGERNRPSQDGPETVGVRSNGQGLDLNRDCMKTESQEMRAALEHVYTSWDPDLVLDLHTTNGTRHGYQLTYAPPLHPDTDPGILSFSRDDLLPAVRSRLREQHGLEVFDYGNHTRQAWYTFGPEGRYVTNYAGLRNRIGILSEATSYLPFRERVRATRLFVGAVLEEAAARGRRILELTRQADARVTQWGLEPESAPALGVRFEFDSRGSEGVLLEKPRPPGTPRETKAPTDLETVTLPIFDRFKALRSSRLPAAYLLPPDSAEVVELLRRHGIVVERLLEDWRGEVEELRIESIHQSQGSFQGGRLIRVEGRAERRTAEVPAGSRLVRTAQPLGILVFHLLEPQSLDGVAAWGLLGERLGETNRHPILKTYEQMRVPTEP